MDCENQSSIKWHTPDLIMIAVGVGLIINVWRSSAFENILEDPSVWIALIFIMIGSLCPFIMVIAHKVFNYLS